MDLKTATARIEQVTQQMQEKVRDNIKDTGLTHSQEKRYLDLYQEKIQLEETIMRDSADQQKLMNRMSFNVAPGENHPMKGPPATFANVQPLLSPNAG